MTAGQREETKQIIALVHGGMDIDDLYDEAWEEENWLRIETIANLPEGFVEKVKSMSPGEIDRLCK